jgi:ribonuclease D
MVSDAPALDAMLARCRGAEALAVDLEANSFHAYNAKLCAVQLAWREAGEMITAIVDPLAVDATPLSKVFGASGPPKVIHDASFDARLLAAAGIELNHVRDTEICARFLAEPATGLASLLAAHFDVQLNKALQRHDWASRPFSDNHIAYLTGDVAYLLDLDKLLRERAAAKQILDEVQLETEHRLHTAAQPSAAKPPHARIKGYGKLNLACQAVLRELVLARAAIAEQADVPLGNICPNALLLEFARRSPENARAIRGICGRRRQVARHADAWLAAVTRGIDLGRPPEEEQRLLAVPNLSRQERSARKSLESRLQAWRTTEAKARDVDRQVVLPGHCVAATITALRDGDGDMAKLRDALATIAGFGTCRVERYAASLFGLTTAAAERPDPEHP